MIPMLSIHPDISLISPQIPKRRFSTKETSQRLSMDARLLCPQEACWEEARLSISPCILEVLLEGNSAILETRDC